MIIVQGSPVKMKLDTGAATDLLPHKMFLNLNNQPQLQKSKAKLTAYGGHDIAYKGKVLLHCTAFGNTQALEFYITKTKAPPILGLQACTAPGLIRKGDCNDSVPVETVTEPLTLVSVQTEFQDVFEGLGRFPDPYKILTKPEAEPVIQPPRRVTMNLHARLRGQLDEMERDGIIANVDSPTDWVHNIVVVQSEKEWRSKNMSRS